MAPPGVSPQFQSSLHKSLDSSGQIHPWNPCKPLPPHPSHAMGCAVRGVLETIPQQEAQISLLNGYIKLRQAFRLARALRQIDNFYPFGRSRYFKGCRTQSGLSFGLPNRRRKGALPTERLNGVRCASQQGYPLPPGSPRPG